MITTMSAPHSPTCTVKDAAKLLNVHTCTVEKLIHDGDLPAGKVGRAYVILTKDVLGHAERVILNQTAERLVGMKGPATKATRRGSNRVSSRSAAASSGSYGR